MNFFTLVMVVYLSLALVAIGFSIAEWAGVDVCKYSTECIQ